MNFPNFDDFAVNFAKEAANNALKQINGEPKTLSVDTNHLQLDDLIKQVIDIALEASTSMTMNLLRSYHEWLSDNNPSE